MEFENVYSFVLQEALIPLQHPTSTEIIAPKVASHDACNPSHGPILILDSVNQSVPHPLTHLYSLKTSDIPVSHPSTAQPAPV